MRFAQKQQTSTTENPKDILKEVLYLAGVAKDNNMLREIVTEAVYNTAATLHSLGEDSALKQLYEKLYKEQGEQARNIVWEHASAVTRTNVATPHPTQPLSDDGIDAVIKLNEVLETHGKSLFQGGSQKLSPADKIAIKDAIDGVAEATSKPVTQSMTIAQEAERERRLSKRIAKAAVRVADHILSATGISSSADLSPEELGNFAQMVKSMGWASAGDQDGKPLATPDVLKKGIEDNAQEARHRYTDALKALSRSLPQTSENLNDVYKIIAKLQNTEGYIATRDLITNAEADNPKKTKTSDFLEDLKALRSITITDEMGEHTVTSSLQAIKSSKNSHLSALDEIIVQAMNVGDTVTQTQLRQNRDMHEEAFKQIINELKTDELFTQLNSKLVDSAQWDTVLAAFNTVLKDADDVKIENLDSETVKTLLPVLEEKYKKSEDVLGAFLKDVNAVLPADATITVENSQVPKNIPEFLDRFLNKTDDTFSCQVIEKVEARLEAIRIASPNGKIVKSNTPGMGTPERDFVFYQTMESLGVAVTNPEKIPHVIIAECGGIDATGDASDMLRGFALLKIMEQSRAKDNPCQVALVPLTEYPDRVLENGGGKIPCVEMIAESMANEHFKEHFLNIQKYVNALNDYATELDGVINDKLTVAKAKERYGIAPKEGDEDKLVEGVKVIMFAGSDATRVGGQAAKPLIEAHGIERLQEKMLDLDPPILVLPYKGLGTAVARSNPSMADMATFSQGRGMMRTDAQEAAHTVDLITKRVYTSLANNDREYSRQDLITLARLNMGNMAKLPLAPELWASETHERVRTMVKEEYNPLFNSPEFKSLMSYTADGFVKATANAARPANRNGEGSSAFPPEVDVQKMRAIGFQLALNAAGVNPSLFYGTSKFLSESKEKNTKELIDLYLDDPKFQSVVNTATYGVVTTDMNVAWKYQGFSEAPDKAQLQEMASQTFDQNEKKELAELQENYGKQIESINDRLILLAKQEKSAVSPEYAERRAKVQEVLREELASLTDKSFLLGERNREIQQNEAAKCLAQMHLEYNETSKALLKLHNTMIGQQYTPDIEGKAAADAILKTLPKTLKEELKETLHNVKQPRENLAAMFNQMVNNELSPADIKKPKAGAEASAEYTAVHRDITTLTTAFERSPIAYQNPHYALDVERSAAKSYARG